VYVTGGWKTGLIGGYEEIFTKFREANLGCYRWDKSSHNAHGDQDQLASIKEYLTKCQAFIMLAENPKAGGGASQLMLGYALLSGIPVVFVDPNAGKHVKPGRSNRDHPMLSNLIGSAMQLNKLLIIVSSVEEAIASVLLLTSQLSGATSTDTTPALPSNPTPPAHQNQHSGSFRAPMAR
jgi:hypothetical protein